MKAIDLHENFAGYLAFENHVMWDAYTPNQFYLFKQKLKRLFQNIGDCNLERQEAIEKAREAIYQNTIAQTKYTNKNLLSSFIVVTVAKGRTIVEARDATEFSVHLVVRTRRCLKNDNSKKCCMIFIDEQARVYQNWKSYIEDNRLPDGVAYAPSHGCYTYEKEKLCMESWPTPTSKCGSKVLKGTDVAATVGAIASAGIAISSLLTPVTAPLLLAASLLEISTGVYTTVRSGLKLLDRSEHQQSISLMDEHSRGCWLGVTSGALSASSSVVNVVVNRLITSGRSVTLLEETFVKGMNVATMLISGTGVVNGVVYIIIKLADDQETTPTDWLEIVSFLAVFTHSAYNFRIASNIMSESRNLRTFTFKNALKEMSKKIFTRTTENHGNVDLIRLYNMIPDKTTKVTQGIEIALKLKNLFEHLVSSKENFNDCIQTIYEIVGQEVTDYLVRKASEFFEKYRFYVETFIRTTLFFEQTLWKLYEKCEICLKTLTIQKLEENIDQIFQLLLDEYKQITWQANDSVYSCSECNGFYSIKN